jgi:hypothetical protein
MHDTVLMGVPERFGGLTRHPQRVVQRERAASAEPIPETPALDIGHGEPEAAAGLAGVVDREDMGMLESGGESDLALEALGPEHGGELRVQDLQRDGAVVLEVVGEIDRRHAPAPELPLDAVAVGEGGNEVGPGVGHR